MSQPRPRSVGSWSSDFSQAGLIPPESLVLGERVLVGKFKLVGSVRFVGETHFGAGVWIGIELGLPDGKNDGTVEGKKYFSCKPNHGIFVRPSMISRESSGAGSLAVPGAGAGANAGAAGEGTVRADVVGAGHDAGDMLACGRPTTDLLDIACVKVVAGEHQGRTGKAWAVPDWRGAMRLLFSLGVDDKIVILRPRDCIYIGEAEDDGHSDDDLQLCGGAPLVGSEVVFLGNPAVVRFAGPLAGAPPEGQSSLWLGMELHRPIGRSDGTFWGHRYFTCAPGHAVFAQAPERHTATASVPSAHGGEGRASGRAPRERLRLRSRRTSTCDNGEIHVDVKAQLLSGSGCERANLAGLLEDLTEERDGMQELLDQAQEREAKLRQELCDARRQLGAADSSVVPGAGASAASSSSDAAPTGALGGSDGAAGPSGSASKAALRRGVGGSAVGAGGSFGPGGIFSSDDLTVCLEDW